MCITDIALSNSSIVAIKLFSMTIDRSSRMTPVSSVSMVVYRNLHDIEIQRYETSGLRNIIICDSYG